MTRGTAAAALSAGNVFDDAFSVMPVATAVIDGAGRLVAVNEAWRSQAVEPTLEIGAHFILACLDERDASAVAFAAALRSVLDGSVGRTKLEYATASKGERRCFSVLISRLKSRDGAVLVREDLTARKLGEARLRTSEDRYRTLAEQAPEAIWMARADRSIIHWTSPWYAKTGQTPEQARGSAWLSAVHPFHRARLVRVWRDAAESKGSWQFDVPICTAPEKKFRWHTVMGRPVIDDGGEVSHWVGLVVDIHDQRLGERALERSEQRFRRLADHAPVKVWMSDTSGKAIWFNRRWLDFRGRRLSEEIGNGWLTGVHADDRDRLKTIFETATRERRPFEVEFRLMRADGDIRWISGWMVPSEDQRGLFDGYVGSAYDVTERKRDERNRLVLIEELNHRVKNTLSIIQAIARQSLKTVPTPERDAFASRLAALSECHNLLTASHWTGVSVQTLVTRTLAPFWSPATVAKRWHVDGPPVTVPPRTALSLALVLHELATNAVKYGALSTEEGNLVVRWQIEEAAQSPRRLQVEWRERTTSPVVPPQHAGFGMRLLQALSRQDGNHVVHELRSEGAVCQLTVPIEEASP